MSAPLKRYGVIVADPPWRHFNSGGRPCPYPTMPVDEIAALPIQDLAAKDCALFLWACWPTLPEAFRVLDGWGFTYKTGLPWLKIIGVPSVDLWGELRVKPTYGLGFWFRGCSELLLLATRGNVTPNTADFVGLLSENVQHSRKPENIYAIAERYPGPYVELFARRSRPGWDVWGNEVISTIAMEATATTRLADRGADRRDATPSKRVTGVLTGFANFQLWGDERGCP